MRRSGLALRITVALLAVAGCTITLVAGIVFSTMQVGATVGPALLASPATGAKAGAILGGVLGVGIVLGTVHAGTRAVRNRFDARPVAETGYANDGIEPLVERLALRFDVPAPTIRVAETTVPHASVSGLTRRGATLVISEGLLDRSNRDQLTAVLAHLANRDALVVTLVAVPAVFGRSVMDGLNSTNESEGVPGALSTDLFGIVAFLLAGRIWLVGKSMLAVFTRQRELAADRAAAQLVGSPATLTEALAILDSKSTEAPATDVRRAQAVSVFSIVESPEPTSTGFTIWEDGRRPLTMRVRNRFVSTGDRLFATHPPTEKRRELLRAYERESVRRNQPPKTRFFRSE